MKGYSWLCYALSVRLCGQRSEVPDQIVRRSKLETECMLIRLKVEFNFLGIIQIRQTIVQKAASSLIFFSFSV